MALQIQITKEIKKCIMDHTSELDVADVSRETGVGYHTVRRLRQCELIINNDERVEVTLKLMEKALLNSADSKEDITKDQNLLRKTIKYLKPKNEKSIENI